MNKLNLMAALSFLAVSLLFTGCSSDSGNKSSGYDPSASSSSSPSASDSTNNIQSQTVDPASSGAWGNPGEGPGAKSGDWRTNSHIKLPYNNIYFAFDSDKISPTESQKLDKIAEFMKNDSSICLVIEGNTDERGSEEYNRGLGERRAISVKEALLSRGIDGSRFQVTSYGEERPADTGHDETAWAKNRRAELFGAKAQ